MPESGRSPAFRRLLLEWLLVAVLATAAAGAASWNGLLARADGAVYDLLALINGRPADPSIIIVAIDDRSLAELGRWPWPRSRHAELLRVLTPMAPKAVIYDVLFAEPAPADADLARAMAAAGNVFLPVLVQPGLNGGGLETIPPAGALAQAAAGLGHVIIRPDPDGVVRRRDRCAAPVPRALAEAVLDLDGAAPAAGCEDQLIAFAGPPGAYRTVAFSSVLRGEVPAEFFTGRRVLVGATALGMTDHFQTPMDLLGGGMSGVELQANILDALGQGVTRGEAGRPWRLALAILPLWILMAGFLALKPAQNLSLALGLGAIVLALSLGLFGLAHLWISPVTALAILLLVFPVWGWRRLAMASDFLKAEFERLGGRLEAPITPAATDHGPVADVVASQARALSGAISRMDALRRFADDILSSLPDATLVTDAAGTVIQANVPAQALLGDDLVGARVIDLLRRLEPVALEAADLGGSQARPLVLRDGRTLLIHTAPRRGEGEGPAGEVIGLTDATHLMATARQREQALQLLTHDMRSPQTSILALLQQSPGLEPTVVGRIAANARRTLALADGFVQFARAEAAALTREPVDLADVVSEMADELWPQAQQKKVLFRQVGCDEPAFTLGERALLGRAFANLFENAVKYSPPGAEILVVLTREAGRIVVSVTDEGPGLTPEEIAAVFEPFQRFGRPQAGGDPGAGLGLAFVRSVVTRHGGQVVCEVAPGGGARFVVELPEADLQAD